MRSKLYRSQLEKIDRNRLYSFSEAIEILKSLPRVKFDETVDVAFKLGIDPKQSDQNVRSALPLPKGTGKKVSVAVIATGNAAEDAKNAGAEFVGTDELIEKIKGGWLEFDVLIATPDVMRNVRPLGRVLGPRGLMPNPKTGTVTEDVGKAVTEAKAGRIEFRNDRGGSVHVLIGKASFSVTDLQENFNAVVQALIRAKPPSSKDMFFQRCTVSTTMSPGIKIDTKDFVREK